MNCTLKKTIAILSLIAIGVLTAFAVVTTHWTLGALRDEITERNYYETIESAESMSVIFQHAEGTVETLEPAIRHGFDMDAFRADHTYIDRYCEQIAPVIQSALGEVDHAAGLYITFNPDFFGHDRSYEIWYSLNENGSPSYTDANNNGIYFEAFEDTDAPHMQYFFQAEKHPGETIWIDPVHDPDIDKDIITCSKAVFIGDEMIGVVGIDIYTQHTTELISEMHTEDGGIAFLLNANDEQIIASKQGEQLSIQSLWPACQKQMQSSEDGILEIKTDEDKYIVTYGHLSNGWKLAIVNTAKDLYQRINYIRTLIITMAVFLMLLLISMIILLFRWYADPVEKAAEILRNIDSENPADEQESDLLQLVQRQARKQREKDLLLAHRSRLAQAGEMLSGILHQWKQPLNKLNILYGNLEDAVSYGDLTEEELQRTIRRSREIIQSMTETIQDFRSYLQPEDAPAPFSVQKTIHSVLALLEDRLVRNSIRIEEDYQQLQQITGYRNALYHVLLNIINNAIDAIEASGRNDGRIEISTQNVSRQGLIIRIHNNGGPMTDEIQNTLFEPYHSTKKDADGSGLGLVISKNLIEKSMGGTLELQNEGEGVTCTISLKGYTPDHD